MNTYRNKRTGIIMKTESIVTGENWEPVKKTKKPKGQGDSPDPAVREGKDE